MLLLKSKLTSSKKSLSSRPLIQEAPSDRKLHVSSSVSGVGASICTKNITDYSSLSEYMYNSGCSTEYTMQCVDTIKGKLRDKDTLMVAP